MSPAQKKIRVFLIIGISMTAGWFGFSGHVFSEDQSVGFYAGPLSVAAKTVIAKAKPAAEENVLSPEEAEKERTKKRSAGGMHEEDASVTELNEENPLSAPST